METFMNKYHEQFHEQFFMKKKSVKYPSMKFNKTSWYFMKNVMIFHETFHETSNFMKFHQPHFMNNLIKFHEIS
jgi:hypothetical protein